MEQACGVRWLRRQGVRGCCGVENEVNDTETPVKLVGRGFCW